jgi:uncharacterized membrane protein YdjX (TVP38/TMEM64 family)
VNRPSRFLQIGGVLAIVALLLSPIIWQEALFDLFAGAERLRTLVQGYGAWGPLVIVLLQTLQSLMVALPGQAIQFTSGYLFGVWWGTLYSWIGVVIGSALAMVLARYFGRPLVKRYVSPSTQDRINDYADEHGTIVVFLLFLLPFLPDNLICFAVGLTRLPLPWLILLAAVGRLPGLFVATLIGAQTRVVPAAYWGLLGAAVLALLLLFWRYRLRIERTGWGAIRRLLDRRDPDGEA